GGIAFAQDARSARFDAMPLAAAGTGCVDFTLPPEGIAAELAGVAHRLRAAGAHAPSAQELDGLPPHHLPPLLPPAPPAPLPPPREAGRVHLGGTGQSPARRGRLRRMLPNRAPARPASLGLPRSPPAEIGALHEDLLIKVTHFFREPEVFEAIKRQVLPALIK